MRKINYILFCTFFFNSVTHAQNKNYVYADSALLSAESADEPGIKNSSESDQDLKEQTIDTVLYTNQLKLSPDSVDNWKNTKAFAYTKYLDSLLKAKRNKEKHTGNLSMPTGPSWLDSFLSSPLTKIFFWVLAGFFVLFILYKLFLTEGVFRKVSKTDKASFPEVAEEIITGESDFDNLIIQAIRNSNYRLAVRYLYLKTLHQLADKRLLVLASDKTNYQYVKEINNQEYRNGFAGLTLSYEYVWYGEFAIEENIYRKIEKEFSDFNG